MPMVSVILIDHGAGNLRSVGRALEAVGASVRISSQPEAVRDAGHVVFPGQGSFGDCMSRLRENGLAEAIRSHIEHNRPYLGICLGLQVLFDKGFERGIWDGLGIIPGTCEAIPARSGMKIPHMGWNHVESSSAKNLASPWLRSLVANWYYFVHSYHVIPADSAAVESLTVNHGGVDVVAAIAGNNVMATQFHPEKSHHAGLNALRAFVEYA